MLHSERTSRTARGLRAAHAAGIIHRDIKPANCFLTTDEEGQPLVKLLDFGIAKAEDTEQAQRLTATSAVLGTPSYIAPELALTNHPAGPRSDIYSLGVVAYRMLTGRVPFAGANAFQVLHAACFEPVPPLRGYVPDVPPARTGSVARAAGTGAAAHGPDLQGGQHACGEAQAGVAVFVALSQGDRRRGAAGDRRRSTRHRRADGVVSAEELGFISAATRMLGLEQGG